MRVTINSDDPAYFAGYIEENFALVHKDLGLDDEGPADTCRATPSRRRGCLAPRRTFLWR